MGILSEALRFSWLSAGHRLKQQSVFGLMSAALAVYSDVVAPIHDAVHLGAMISVAVGVIFLFLFLAISRHHIPLTARDANNKLTLIPKELPFTMLATRDVLELAIISSIFFLLTWGGQVFVARPQTVGGTPPTEPVSVFGTLVPQLNGLRSDVAVVHNEVAAVHNEVQSITKVLETTKKETSDDPRKELANLGVTWTADNFLEAVKTGDMRTLHLFVAGGMSPVQAVSQGRPLPVMLALNTSNPAEVVAALVAGGLDVNHTYDVPGGISPVKTTLLGRAIEKGNVDLVRALLKHHIEVNAALQTFGTMGLARNTYPLPSAVSWQQFEIAEALLDQGADPGVGDFAAYREAQSLLPRIRIEEARQKLQDLIPRLAPAGEAATRVGSELRLREVEAELNQVALESLRSARGSSQRAESDRRYDQLQVERAALQQKLGIHSTKP
jgi:hypothetical protein